MNGPIIFTSLDGATFECFFVTCNDQNFADSLRQNKRKGKLYRGLSDNREKLLESVDVDCPVCLEMPRHDHIYSCLNGHNICKACYEKLSVKTVYCHKN